MVRRYTHAHQFKRANRALKLLRIRLGRRGHKVYSLHAPEVECIGKARPG